MTALVRIILVAATLFLAGPAMARSDAAPDIFRDHVARAGLPGAALIVVRKGTVAHRLARGVCRDGEPLTPSTPLLIGSLSKPLTAEAALRLVAEGRLDLDAPIKGRDGLSARMLLDQRSGFERAQGMSIPTPGSDAWDALEPGHARGPYVYSNLNYVLLGDVLARVSGRPFGRLMDDTVFNPLGMEGSSAEATAPARCGHQLLFGVFVPRPEPSWSAHLVPAGFMSASADDLGAFLLAKLAEDKQRLLAVEPETYARGWRHERIGKDRIFWHSGASGSFRASMVLLPDRDIGFAVLTNTGGWLVEDPVDDLAVALMTHYRDEAPEPPGGGLERWARLGLGALLAAALVMFVAGLMGPQVGRGRIARLVAPGLFLVGLPVGLQMLTGVGLPALWRLAPDLAAVMLGLPLLGLLGAVIALVRTRKPAE